MTVVDYIAGLLIAVLAGMGVGGGGLLVLYLTFIKNMPQLDAQGLNLAFFVAASLSSLLYHVRKRKMNFKLTLLLCIFGVPGAYLGFKAAAATAPETVRRVFGWLLIISGCITFFSSKRKKDQTPQNNGKKSFFSFFERKG